MLRDNVDTIRLAAGKVGSYGGGALDFQTDTSVGGTVTSFVNTGTILAASNQTAGHYRGTIGFYSDQDAFYSTFQDLRYAGLEFQGGDPVAADSKAVFAHVAGTGNGMSTTVAASGPPPGATAFQWSLIRIVALPCSSPV